MSRNGLFVFDFKPSFFLFQPGGVIPFERIAFASVEFEYPLSHVVQEITIVSHSDNRPGVFC